ncbi:MAG: EAL domain-containing protein, partial [Lachnospiraceae bacterium]|nr:EAL domain-containing protein [Lachnospiraceae bacterium]
CNTLYIYYIFSATGTWYRIRSFWKKLIVALPYLGVLGLLATNEYTGWIFGFTPDAGYARGPLVLIVYALAAIYMIFGVIYLCLHKYALDIGSWIALISMYVFNFTAVAIQYFYNRLLIECYFTAITLLLAVLFIQRPEKQVDMSTGLRGYRAFCEEMGKIAATKQKIQVVIVCIRNARDMSRFMSEEIFYQYIHATEEQFRRFSKADKITLESYFEQPGTFYIIIEDANYNPVQVVSELRGKVKENTENLFGNGVRPDVKVVAVQFPDDIKDVGELLRFGHNFMRFANVDKSFVRCGSIVNQRAYQIEAHIDEVLSRAFENNALKIRYKPVWSVEEGKYVSARAEVFIDDPEYGIIDPEVLENAAGERGLSLVLGSHLIAKVFEFVGSNEMEEKGYEHISVSLSESQCMQMNLLDEIWHLQQQYKISPSRIEFSIKESAYEIVSKIHDDNIRKLSSQGYLFAIDSFGKGYSNMRHILDMPIHAVRLDKELIEAAKTGDSGKALLGGCIKMLLNIHLEVIACGLEDEQTRQMLTYMGCQFLEEDAKADPEEEMEE